MIDHAAWTSDDRGDRIPQSSAPAVVDRMIRLLAPLPGQRVLEIGTGSGWSAALLARAVGPAGRVVTLDVVAPLVERAAARYRSAGLANVEAHLGDGRAGWPAGGPYDRVVAWATPETVPQAWLDQAAGTTVLVTPVALAPVANANAVVRCRLIGGEPRDGALHPGNFVEMGLDARAAFGTPTRFVDAVLAEQGPPTWVSGARLHGRPAPEVAELARRLAAAAPGRRLVDPAKAAAFGAFVLATSRNPASAGIAGRWGLGVATGDGAAVLHDGALVTAGATEARDELLALHERWVECGKPGHEELVVAFRRVAGGLAVRAICSR